MIDGLEKSRDPNLALTDPLVSWILDQVEEWERFRDQEYSDLWGEYYRIWRGKWSSKDQHRQVERAKIIAPATQQAIEAQVAEMEESIFARKRWFDLDGFNPFQDKQVNEAASEIIIEFLTEDMEEVGIKPVVTECLLNGALYGTGICKILVEKYEDKQVNAEGRLDIQEKIRVCYAPVDPMNFLIDPASTCIDDALGCAHAYIIPTHKVLQKQEQGIYRRGPIGSLDESLYTETREETRPSLEHCTEIIEYHGLVPAKLLRNANEADILDFAAIRPESGEGEFREVIAVIANRNARLMVNENPFLMQDRGFVAFQFDTVPNRFWGRGVAEKAYNSQKALDVELRARIDSLSLSTYPMTIVNTLMAPRSMNSTVNPGKRIAVNGNPSEAISILQVPGPDANSYRHANDLERMVQMATGSVAPTSPLGVNPTNETASGMSMMLGAMFKRSKRTLRNIEEGMLKPLIQKTAWRYMQFNRERYPVADYRFIVTSGLGASAKEFEIAQLSQYLQTMVPGSAEYWIILRAMLELHSLDAKDELLQLVNGHIESAMNPQPPQPDIDQQLKSRELDLKEAELQFKVAESREKWMLEGEKVRAEAERDRGEAEWNRSTAIQNQLKAQAEARKTAAEAQQAKAGAILNLAKAREAMNGRGSDLRVSE